MTTRNLKKELDYYGYGDLQRIDYEDLIVLLKELIDRIDKLEATVQGLETNAHYHAPLDEFTPPN